MAFSEDSPWAMGQDVSDTKVNCSTFHANASNQRVEPPVWDRDGMMYRMAGNEGLAKRVMMAFLEDAPQRIQALADSLETGDVGTAQRLAHAIKGSAANVGGEVLRASALAIEHAARNADLNAARACMHDLQADFERLKNTMAGVTATGAYQKA